MTQFADAAWDGVQTFTDAAWSASLSLENWVARGGSLSPLAVAVLIVYVYIVLRPTGSR